MQKTNQTLCSKAWTDVNIAFGTKKLRHCCKSTYELFPDKLTSDFFNNSIAIQQRRNDLLNGIENSQCEYCWDSREKTGTSYRDHRNTWRSPSDVSENIEVIEIMLDNLCDMSCIYCDEGSSHKIAQEKNLEHHVQRPSEENYAAFLDWLSTLDYEYTLSFLGGELTYSKNFYYFLSLLASDQRFNQRKIYLALMTNGNTTNSQLDKFIELYDRLPDKWELYIVFSNEAIETQSELVRWGLDWDRYQTNMERYLSYNRVSTIGLCPTVSLFTMTGIVDYLHWSFEIIRKHNKKVCITGNWVNDGILHPGHSKRIEVIPILRELVYLNQDLFYSDKWYTECQTWINQLEIVLGTKTYTDRELNDFLQTMAKQKQSDKIFNLTKYL